ncbi:MAG: hypothetical protein E6618_10585 [Staphylococcus warneri]|nr:hypothetical protein [Staphylococcus lugdunensis]MDU6254639.1 hypothetical protein [Staphylococcus warneri]
MIKERITNILKRMAFEYFKVTEIDNNLPDMVEAEITNMITKQKHYIYFPYDMLERWYSYQNLKYNLIKEYILNNISEDYYSLKEDVWSNK